MNPSKLKEMKRLAEFDQQALEEQNLVLSQKCVRCENRLGLQNPNKICETCLYLSSQTFS